MEMEKGLGCISKNEYISLFTEKWIDFVFIRWYVKYLQLNEQEISSSYKVKI